MPSEVQALRGKQLLVPRDVFPKEKVPKNFKGWSATVGPFEKTRQAAATAAADVAASYAGPNRLPIFDQPGVLRAGQTATMFL